MASVLGTPTSPPRKLIFAQTGMMGGFVHISTIAQHLPWRHRSVEAILLTILVIFNLVLQLVVVKVVWVLGPPTSHLIKMIIGLAVEMFCHLRVGIIHTQLFPDNIGPILHYLA